MHRAIFQYKQWGSKPDAYFSESLKELGATFGANILPVVTSGITTINKWVQAFGELDGTSQKLIVGMAAVAAALALY